MVEKELGYSCSIHHFDTRGKNYPLTKAMVTGGRLVMRSMESFWKGQEPLKARGVMAGTIGWVKTFCTWQVTHPETYF